MSYMSALWNSYLPPANEVCEGYVFTGVCLSTGGVPGQVPPGQPPPAGIPPPQGMLGYGLQAGGTHLTGVLCCCIKALVLVELERLNNFLTLNRHRRKQGIDETEKDRPRVFQEPPNM